MFWHMEKKTDRLMGSWGFPHTFIAFVSARGWMKICKMIGLNSSYTCRHLFLSKHPFTAYNSPLGLSSLVHHAARIFPRRVDRSFRSHQQNYEEIKMSTSCTFQAHRAQGLHITQLAHVDPPEKPLFQPCHAFQPSRLGPFASVTPLLPLSNPSERASYSCQL